MPMEVIVRPFQSRQVTPPQRYLSFQLQSQPNVINTWGRSGRGKSMQGSTNSTVTAYLDQQIVEKRA